ncbi:LLM class flavin-dependent oxidoreductase [Paeniglutamicibacter psychrophenolicus]|uniref:LLM class flavin-dependent oxidoreductase n=1 Tax=Paeniglutamicibacter psychrophenolicus TaxID=257454 RepID=UPI00278632F4|nr:LLM class flavin-dependent oxidoreductase [Paeniglutamicibacter psychrophenolicus]MDQ0094217.1 FMN-dependent oxidoreductase (nitrilotriacetate monooxygenase family) [Paeniglutamicibacter psychrophenolicus]
MDPTRQLHLNAFIYGAGHHTMGWRHPDSSADRVGDIAYYEDLARLAERGCLDAVFFADGQSVNHEYAAGIPWFLEPVTALSAMARATEHIGLVTTISASFYTPFHAARLLASLDHISSGRAGINVVTSMFDAEARNHGLDALPGHAQRYERAEEFVDAMQGLWDSWSDSALVVDREAGRYLDPSQIRPINHRGNHFSVAGPLTVPRCPQGRPVLFQAGSSEAGRSFAARYAEAIYSVSWDRESALEYAVDMRRRLELVGRAGNSVPILPGLVTYIGQTREEAREKKAALDAYLDTDSAITQLNMFTGQDYTSHPLDGPVAGLPPAEGFTGPQGRYLTVQRIIETKQPTLRELLGFLAAGGGHATMIGTPTEVADEIEEWFISGACDGFNLMCPSFPAGLDDFVELVVPILQARGLFRSSYPGSTLRETLGLAKPARQEIVPVSG